MSTRVKKNRRAAKGLLAALMNDFGRGKFYQAGVRWKVLRRLLGTRQQGAMEAMLSREMPAVVTRLTDQGVRLRDAFEDFKRGFGGEIGGTD